MDNHEASNSYCFVVYVGFQPCLLCFLAVMQCLCCSILKIVIVMAVQK